MIFYTKSPWLKMHPIENLRELYNVIESQNGNMLAETILIYSYYEFILLQ